MVQRLAPPIALIANEARGHGIWKRTQQTSPQINYKHVYYSAVTSRPMLITGLVPGFGVLYGSQRVFPVSEVNRFSVYGIMQQFL